jgi:hypothetical protein
MMRYDPRRADDRPIEDKALGLLFAMTDEQAKALHNKLATMIGSKTTAGELRAAMFFGQVPA